MSKKNNNKTRFLKSKSFLVLVVLFIFILILAFFFGEGGIIEIINARSRIEELQENISELKKEKGTLVKEIEELEKNPMALERTAREKLWLMKKNEKVVVIVKNSDKSSGK